MQALIARYLVIAAVPVSLIALASVMVATEVAGVEETARAAPPESSPAVGSGRAEGRAAFRGLQARDQVHNFYFTRAAYSGGRGFRSRGSWATDYPQADRWIVSVMRRLTGVDVYPREHPVRLDDPELRRFPFIYTLEVGDMNLTDAEVEALRGYLLAGGFMMVDDFWGTREWRNFEREMRRVLPEYQIVDVPLDHPIFATFYQLDEIIQVPVVDRGIWGGPTHEQDGYEPYVKGIFDEDGRLMVAINWNTDLGDAWEWAEEPRYPLKYSTYAYQVAANFIIYAMTR